MAVSVYLFICLHFVKTCIAQTIHAIYVKKDHRIQLQEQERLASWLKYGAIMDLGVNEQPCDITAECGRCRQPFLVKYWDEELDWYIEINLTENCRNCQGDCSEPEQAQLIDAIDRA